MLSRFRITTLAAGVLLLSVAWAGYRWWFAPERVIVRRLHALADVLTVPASESDLDRLAGVARLKAFFADVVHISVADTAPIVMSRDTLIGTASSWRATGRGSTVRVERAEVTVDSDTSAGARVAVEVIRRAHTADTRDVHLVQLRLASADGEWVISAADLPRSADAD